MRYVGLEHIEPNTMRLLGYGRADDFRSASLSFQEGDVLYSRMRPYLNKVWVAEFDGVCSSEFLVFARTPSFQSEYLAARLNAPDFVAFAEAHVSGERPRVNFEKLAAFLIDLPPVAEQQRIVDKLNGTLLRIARGAAAADRALERIKRYRAAVARAACEGKLVELDASVHRRDASGSSSFVSAADSLAATLQQRRKLWRGSGNYKEPLPAAATVELSPPPEGWTWASPDQLAAPDNDSICAGPFGTIFKARDFRPEGIPIIFLRHVQPDHYSTADPRYMDRKKWEELFRPYSVYGGELLITKLGDPPGACAMFPSGIGPAMLTPDVIKFDVNEAIASPRYLLHYLNSDVARHFTTGVAFGTTRLRLTLSLFRQLPIALPPLTEQLRIVAEVDRRLAATDRLKSTLMKQRQQTAAARDALLKQAFTGHLVEQDRSDEPAVIYKRRLDTDKTRATRPQREKLMSKAKSRFSPSRRPLLEVLRDNDLPITPEELFRQAGFTPSQADLFYRELALIRDVLIEEKPSGASAKQWPHDARVLLQLKRPT